MTGRWVGVIILAGTGTHRENTMGMRVGRAQAGVVAHTNLGGLRVEDTLFLNSTNTHTTWHCFLLWHSCMESAPTVSVPGLGLYKNMAVLCISLLSLSSYSPPGSQCSFSRRDSATAEEPVSLQLAEAA